MDEVFFTPIDPIGKLRWLSAVLADARLTTGARAIAAALLSCHNTRTGRLDPGSAELARLAGLSEKGARAAREQLIAAGWLEKRARAVGGRQRAHAYRLAKVPAAARPVLIARDGELISGAPPEVTAGEPMNLQPMKEPGSGSPGDEGQQDDASSAALRRLLDALERRKGAAWSRSWLRGCRLAGLGADGVLALEAPSRCAADYLGRDPAPFLEAGRAAGLGVRALVVTLRRAAA